MTEEQTSTPATDGRSAKAKLAAAVIAGYVLGRTKKGRAAFKLASWISGNQAGPQEMNMAWTGVTQMTQPEQATQIAQALGEVGETTVKGAADTASNTTKKAGEGVKRALGKVSDTTKKAGGGVKGAVGKATGRKQGKVEESKP